MDLGGDGTINTFISTQPCHTSSGPLRHEVAKELVQIQVEQGVYLEVMEQKFPYCASLVANSHMDHNMVLQSLDMHKRSRFLPDRMV